jgi:hypothetical protein
MSQARRAALHLLNNDWSRAVWKHWLSNIFLPPVEPIIPPASTPPAPEAVNRSPSSEVAQAKLSSTCSERAREVPESTGRDLRRSELRARFDALSDRMTAVEDGLETLLRRSAQREKSERRSEHLNTEAIDQVALSAERQAAVLEGMLGTVSRLEHALSRLEHGLSRVERALGERNRRDSHFPSAAPPAPSTRGHTSELDEIDPNESSSINGFLSEVSLSTVMAMLEIERHTGRLKVATDDGKLASFELAEGSVVSSRLLENDADPLQTLRTALCWKQGRFWFRQQPAEATSYAPRSIGSLLLEATRQNDESFANVG